MEPDVLLRRLPPLVCVALVAAFLVGGALAVRLLLDRGPGSEEMRCNGSVRLCDRRLDEVTFAGAHNAMAAKGDGWLIANQDEGMPAQLRAGVRALLLDTQYWETEASVAATLRSSSLAPQAMAFLSRVNNQPRPGPLLCHSFCAMGSKTLTEGLSEIRDFLDANRNEVLLVIFEDLVSVEDTEAAFRESGLLRYAYARPPGTPWPTLRQLIERDERLVVFSERGLAGPGWYHPAWGNLQDTRFAYPALEAFDCAANRGSAGSDLLMVNHWLGGLVPDRHEAESANRYDVLKRRLEQCRSERGKAPNILAVDFVVAGDLLKVVREINGD